MGDLGRFPDTVAPDSSLAACRFSYLGLTELLTWPCPLTVLENWLEARAGIQPYQGGFLLHYLDRVVYPDISATTLAVAGVLVCALNLTFYGWRTWSAFFTRSAK